jgi:hypothetical protein
MRRNKIQESCEMTVCSFLQGPMRLEGLTDYPNSWDAIYRLFGGGIETHVGVYICSRLRLAGVSQLVTLIPAESCNQRMLFTEYVAPSEPSLAKVMAIRCCNGVRVACGYSASICVRELKESSRLGTATCRRDILSYLCFDHGSRT